MKKFWYLPIAAVVGAASLTVWGQANAGPPPAESPGVVVTADVTSGSDEMETEDTPALLSTPNPTASITANPDHAAPGTQLIPAGLQTFAPAQTTDSATHDVSDDKGGLRNEGASDDAPGDDNGGLRDEGISDDGPGDDKGGKR